MNRNPKRQRNPEERGLPCEQVLVKTKDNLKLRGWLLLQKQSKKHPTIVYLHESTGNLGTRMQFLEDLYKQVSANVLIVAYRGYSYSEGFPSEKGLKADSLSILDYAFSREDVFDIDSIFLLGKSLGAGAAVWTAVHTDKRIRGVILENMFTSLDDLFKHHLPIVSRLRPFILRNHWNSLDLISQIKVPILLVYAKKDVLVPKVLTEKLLAACKDLPHFFELAFETDSHTASYLSDTKRYFKELQIFLCHRFKR